MNATPIVILALAACAASSSGSVLSVAGNDTLVGNRSANLIVNGSFEADGGVAANGSYWATGTTLSPIMSLSGWTASGQVASYAIWGNDGFGGINGSASLPHGTNGLYFGGGIMASVAPFPTEAADGQVSFASTPTILPKPTDGPVTLQQTVSGLNPSSIYLLDFWTSGEDVGSPQLETSNTTPPARRPGAKSVWPPRGFPQPTEPATTITVAPRPPSFPRPPTPWATRCP